MRRESGGVYRYPRPPVKPTLTKVLLGLLVVCFAIESLNARWFVDTFAVEAGPILAGQWWRIFTGALLHANLLHLAMNAWAGWIVGARVEAVIGHWRLAAITLASAIGSGLVVAWGGQSAIGFSGVLYGWLASWLAFHLTPRYPELHLTGAQLRAFLQALAINVVFSLLPFVSALGHLGGFVAGFVVAALLGLRGRERRREPARAEAMP